MLPSLLLTLASASWTPLSATGISSISTAHTFGDTILACGTGGCASSIDNGLNWQTHLPKDAASIKPVFSGHNGISCDGHAIHLTRDGGRSWKSWVEGVGSGKWIRNVDIRDEFAYASAHDYDYENSTGTGTQTCNWYVRKLDAPSWTRIDRRPNNNDNCSYFKVGAGGRLFRITDTLLPGAQYPIFVGQTSLDGGLTWASEDTNTVIKRVGGNASIYLKSHYAKPGLLSLDSGRTWTIESPPSASPMVLDGAWRFSDTMPWRSISGGQPREISIDSLGDVRSWARTSTKVWAAGRFGLFSSSDSGRSWSSPAGVIPLDAGIDMMFWHGGSLFGWLRPFPYRYVLIQSKDEGRSWTTIKDHISTVGASSQCGAELLYPIQTRIPETRDSYRSDTLWITANGSVETARRSTSSCTQYKHWDTIAFANSLNPIPSSPTVRRIVKIPSNSQASSPVLVEGGIFLLLSSNTVAFVANGTDSAIPVKTFETPIVRLVEASSGAILTASSRVYRCTAKNGCQPASLTGSDSLWITTGFLSNSDNALFGFSYRRDATFLPDYSRILLHASIDTGRTWTNFELPGIPRSVALVPAGILLSTSGAGLWLLPSDTFRLTGASPLHPQRSSKPSLLAHGRILSLSGIAIGARLRVLDASGRVVLDVHPEVRERRASAMLPAGATGVLFAKVTGPGMNSSFRWTMIER